jgi:hypothetical protein
MESEVVGFGLAAGVIRKRHRLAWGGKALKFGASVPILNLESIFVSKDAGTKAPSAPLSLLSAAEFREMILFHRGKKKWVRIFW